MTEYVVWRVLDHHRQGALYRASSDRRSGTSRRSRTSSDISVGIMGLGELGSAAARGAAGARLRVNGWSRRPKDLPA
jgi:glyoxylate/hydroxypyruvate reductase A